MRYGFYLPPIPDAPYFRVVTTDGPVDLRLMAEIAGVDTEELHALNPRLVYVSISGFGQTGPYADRAGLDQIAQGLSGFMTQMSPLPPRSLKNAIRCPSGDHAGKYEFAESFVRSVTPLPSAFIV